jgi:hypothetical protein
MIKKQLIEAVSAHYDESNDLNKIALHNKSIISREGTVLHHQ